MSPVKMCCYCQQATSDMSSGGGTQVVASYEATVRNEDLRVSRKRHAASKLGSIPAKAEVASVSDLDDDYAKRQRFDSSSTVDSSDLNVSAAISSAGSAPCCPVSGVKRDHLEPLTNGNIYDDFIIVGAGREAQAQHVHTHEIYNAKIITDAEYKTIQKVVARLSQAHLHYKEDDLIDMIEMVFPMKTVMVEDDCEKKILFTPAHYGTLHSFAYHKGSNMSESDVKPLFYEMVRLVSFCHAVGIVVREIKPRRLAFANKERTKLRLVSVHEVVVCEDPLMDELKEKFGSPAYVPPEVLSSACTAYNGKPADVWGIGVVLYLLLTGCYPFFDTTPLGVFQRIKRARFFIPKHCYLSLGARALIHGLLRRCPAERPTAAELLHMPWENPITRPVHINAQPASEPQQAASAVVARITQEAISLAAMSVVSDQADEREEFSRVRELAERRANAPYVHAPPVHRRVIKSGAPTTSA